MLKRGGTVVGHARDERRLRTDDNQVGPELGREAGYGRTVEHVDGVQGGELADAGIPGGRVKLRDVRVCGQRAGDGVLTRAGSDDEDPHGPSAYRARTVPDVRAAEPKWSGVAQTRRRRVPHRSTRVTRGGRGGR